MKTMYIRRLGPAIVLGALVLPLLAAAQWNNPTGTPPNNNAATPINVSATAQAKAGGLDVNSLLEASSLFVDGDSILGGLGAGNFRYLNFGSTAGTSGYGIRNNNGTMEFKNSGGSWTSFAAGGSLPWLVSGNNIYNTNTANVGINAPSPSYRLDVNPSAADTVSGRIGTVAIGTMGHGVNYAGIAHNSMAATGNFGFLQQNDGTTYLNTATGRSIRFRENNTDRMVMSGANFGLGAITPTIRFAIGDADTGFNWVSDGNFTLLTNNAERMRFTSSGTVGIGTSSPLEMLHVGGNVRANGFCINASCITSWGSGSMGGSGTTNYVPKFTAATTLGNSLIFDNGTNVGIGTASPTNKLHVVGTQAMFESGTTAEGGQIELSGPTDAASSDIMLDNYQGRFRIIATNPVAETLTTLQNGNVGVGTIAPAHKLTVQGPATSGVDAIRGTAGIANSATYGVFGAAGSYYGSLGRGDGYSYVGSGSLYNAGTIYGNSFLYLSDARLKENIEPLDKGLLTLMQLRPVSFTWKEGIEGLKGIPDTRAGTDDIGFIAQEVEAVLPDVVDETTEGTKSVDYVRIVPVLVKAVQEQQAEIEQLKAQIADLQESR